MKYMYSVQNNEELKQYEQFKDQYQGIIDDFISYLKSHFNVVDIPQYVVFSNFEMTTKVHSNIVIPAYTNDIRMVITPEINRWKEIYLKQLDDYETDERTEVIKNYYENKMTDKNILQIIGHEFAHWSELFLDGFDEEEEWESGIWFEEGMVEYISRHYFLNEEELEDEKKINEHLVQLFEEHHRSHSLENFGKATYEGNYASIFYDYWRSYLKIDMLVRQLGTVEKVFERYQAWDKAGRKVTLTEWFDGEEENL